MIIVPFDHEESKRSGLVVIIEKEQLARMKTGDPITLMPNKIGGVLPTPMFPDNYGLILAYEEDSGPLYEMAAKRDIQSLMKYILRGHAYNDKDGKIFRNFGKVGETPS